MRIRQFGLQQPTTLETITTSLKHPIDWGNPSLIPRVLHQIYEKSCCLFNEIERNLTAAKRTQIVQK
ncbi:hypothetical protein [Marinomonas sp.]|uniref:hypothetical protein n=1 Tax=Marinomonas sp. TaxID=1904862 RepID=UPI003BA9A6CE